ncbi:MAG: protein translocase subunit SecF [Eubacteriales bacterium]|nr:protein translocase subunit SecF [Eubacteriales bacterium]
MIDIVGNRKYFFALSIIIMLVGILFLFINGVTLDIQFEGGSQIQIAMEDENFDAEEAADLVNKITGKSVHTQKLSTYNPENAEDSIDILLIRVTKESTFTREEINSVFAALKESFKVKEGTLPELETVEPFIGKEMLNKGILAVVISSVLVMLYVWVRFKIMGGLAAAVTSVLALVHDIAVMFFTYVIFNMPLNDVFIAALLTILGYSLNDTIILYDRIRENSKLLSKMSHAELVNKSIAETLSRTINTGVTTLLSVLTLYIFALANNVETLVSFSFPLLIGMISGIYSSVFIASPLWVLWKERRSRRVIRTRSV